MGLLRRRLIFAKDFDMNKFLTSQYIRRHKMYLYMTEKLLFVYFCGCLSQLLVRDSAFTSESWSAPWGE